MGAKRVYDAVYRKKNAEKYRAHARISNGRRTKEQNKDQFIKSTYGITLAQYDAMHEMQDGKCAICGGKETRKSRYGGVCRLHIDHDHKTGKVRGLLCSKCNFGLGAFNDDTETLVEAISYLQNNKT